MTGALAAIPDQEGRRRGVMPRFVAVFIAVALTVVVLVNVVLQAFGLGDSAIYVMYPAVLAALGLTVKRPTSTADTGTPGVESTEQAPPVSLTPLEDVRAARHRQRGRP